MWYSILSSASSFLFLFEFSRSGVFFPFHFIEMLGPLSQFWSTIPQRVCLFALLKCLFLFCLLTACDFVLHNTTVFSSISGLFPVKMITQELAYHTVTASIFFLAASDQNCSCSSDIFIWFLFVNTWCFFMQIFLSNLTKEQNNKQLSPYHVCDIILQHV